MLLQHFLTGDNFTHSARAKLELVHPKHVGLQVALLGEPRLTVGTIVDFLHLRFDRGGLHRGGGRGCCVIGGCGGCWGTGGYSW